MDKRDIRTLVLDIGHLSHVHGTDISKIMDELNTLESYKPFQAVLKEHKEFKKQLELPNKYETYFGIIRDLMGYNKDMDNTTLGHMFQDIAVLKSKSKRDNLEEHD